MTIKDGFEKIFQNAQFIFDSNIKDCETYEKLEVMDKTYDHNFIVELINWFAQNYNTDLLGMYDNYVRKCKQSVVDKVIEFINEDL